MKNHEQPSTTIWPKLRGLPVVLAALVLYIVVTLACLLLAWFIPGQGLEIILIRLFTATMIPGCMVFLLAPMLQRQRAMLNGFLLGMCCIATVYLIGASAVVMKFRL